MINDRKMTDAYSGQGAYLYLILTFGISREGAYSEQGAYLYLISYILYLIPYLILYLSYILFLGPQMTWIMDDK